MNPFTLHVNPKYQTSTLKTKTVSSCATTTRQIKTRVSKTIVTLTRLSNRSTWKELSTARGLLLPVAKSKTDGIKNLLIKQHLALTVRSSSKNLDQSSQ